MQGVGFLCSSWPCAAYMSNGNPLLRAACTPLALRRKGETHSLRSALLEAACPGHEGRETLALLRHHAFQRAPSSPERNPAVVSIATIAWVGCKFRCLSCLSCGSPVSCGMVYSFWRTSSRSRAGCLPLGTPWVWG